MARPLREPHSPFGAGLEWNALSVSGRPFPLRFGWRRAELPFSLATDDPVESTLAGGFGLRLAGAGNIPLAQIDLGVEHGTPLGGDGLRGFLAQHREPAAGGILTGAMRVYFRTFGCKANQYDTERMRQAVEFHGAVAVPGWGDADVCVVNTCTVTNQADAEARRFLRRIRRDNPATRVVVAGCSAALRGAEYRAMEGVSAVVAGPDPKVVAEAVGRAGGAHPGSGLVQLELRRALDRIDTEPVGAELLRERAGATRGWLKIQDGCDRRCSFCATRLARGASRSRTPEVVVREAALLARTHPELVLTGIHIGHYGRDLDPASSLSLLLATLLDRIPDVRFRLGSVEATEVDSLLLDLMTAAGGRVAPHLHMPLQSGADPVLRRMRRWHTREAYRRRALEIAERLPVLGLGADRHHRLSG